MVLVGCSLGVVFVVAGSVSLVFARAIVLEFFLRGPLWTFFCPCKASQSHPARLCAVRCVYSRVKYAICCSSRILSFGVHYILLPLFQLIGDGRAVLLHWTHMDNFVFARAFSLKT